MADYNKWKVTELKAELKRRGVPQTGLKLKVDFINKLTELDSEAHDEPVPEEDTAPQPSSEQKEDGGIDDEAKEGETEVPPQPATEAPPTQDAPSAQEPDQDRAALDVPPVSKAEDHVPEADQPDKRDEPPQAEQPVATAPEAKEQEISGATKPQDSESREENEVPTTETVVEAAAPVTAEPSSSAPSEPENEMRKRKRRSRSPAPSEETAKKSKVDNENPRVVLKEDDVTPAAEPPIIPQSRVEVETAEEKGEYAEQPSDSRPERKHDGSPERPDHRFKDLLPPNKKRKRTPSPGLSAQPDEREVEPALHPATSAIYIREFMRPLQPASLKRHLTSLASPDNDPEVLLDFFLDPIKTHCFALFKSVSAASQVRSRVHGALWPNERDRKPLWADFIPEDKVGDWIKTEQESASQGRTGPRWEVFYERTENGFEASLQEYRGTATGPTPAPRQNIDTGPRRESQPSGPPPSSRQSGKGFKALDDHFLSTTTKPKLYYLPVSRDVIDRRLERFAALSRRGSQYRQSGGDDTRRITFEDVDVFVDGGPEYSLARGRGGRRPGRGSWRGRAR